MLKYQKFHPDLWRTVFNYEAIAVVTTPQTTGDSLSMKLTGHFRTNGDYIGLQFTSEDDAMHAHCKYDTDSNYSGVSLSFSPQYTGTVVSFDDTYHQPAMVIRTIDGDAYYVTLGFYGVKHAEITEFEFTGTHYISSWVDMGSVSLVWEHTEIDEETGEEETKTGTGVLGDDYDIDFVNGRVFTAEGSIPYKAKCTLTYMYNTHGSYYIPFGSLYEGTHPGLGRVVPSNNIASVSIPAIPPYFVSGEKTMTGRSDSFTITFQDMTITGGWLNDKPKPLPKHDYRVAEGFDDEYDKNPKRLIESMATLGYNSIINLYIGASHFYDKTGMAGQEALGVGDMYLDTEKGINEAYRTWLADYTYHMKRNGFEDIVISVAMENLQMPESWKQLLWNGQPAATGWNPPTNFYSPNNPDVRTYIDKITRQSLDIVVEQGMRPILQLGESWYWWQEFQPGNVNEPYEGQPPALYDEYTKQRFEQDMGYPLPIYDTSHIEMTEQAKEVSKKIQQYLGEYTVFMKEIADSYPDSQFTILFFPPSVLDKDRTPEFMRIVNAPFDYWRAPNLDFIQIEDYDWVVHDNPEHKNVFTQAWFDMDYPFSKQHYFAGFAWEQFNIPIETQWQRIERAAQEARGRRYAEIFIWAGTQIRRDSWLPKRNTYIGDASRWIDVNMKQKPTEEG